MPSCVYVEGLDLLSEDKRRRVIQSIRRRDRRCLRHLREAGKVAPNCLSGGENLGDDADTTGAVCGQLAGAYWGELGIPAEWREDLARQDMIEQALSRLLRGSG